MTARNVLYKGSIIFQLSIIIQIEPFQQFHKIK